MGKRKVACRQGALWTATAKLPRGEGDPFYERLNCVLAKAGFDGYVEGVCKDFYAPRLGRPSLAPGNYFRLLLVGYFEGCDSERQIAWRLSDSLSLRRFLGLALTDRCPDHSTLSHTRRRISAEAHGEVFVWVLRRLEETGLLRGTKLGVDGTTLLANASMRGIVRRDTGEGYRAYLRRLAEESGMETPRLEDLQRFDRKRKKKTSNEEWTHPSDADARVARTKDGRTRMAHKVEHAVDLESGALAGVKVHGADQGDTKTLAGTLEEAEARLEAAAVASPGARAVVCDKGYHSDGTMVAMKGAGVRSYVSEPRRGRRRWKGTSDRRRAVYANRRRMRGAHGRRLMRRRGELVERSFAHVYDTGGMRRLYLRGRENIAKRLLIQAAGFNLGLLMRHDCGIGKPRSLQGAALTRFSAFLVFAFAVFRPPDRLWGAVRAFGAGSRYFPARNRPSSARVPPAAPIPPSSHQTPFIHRLLAGSPRVSVSTCWRSAVVGAAHVITTEPRA